MSVQRMDHVGVVVEDLQEAVAFFVELGLEAQGDGPQQVEGAWVDAVVGIEGVRCEIQFVATPDGHSRLELTRFHAPDVVAPSMTPNTLGLRRLMFAVDDIDDTVRRLEAISGELVGEIAQYEDVYRLCYFRGPSGIIVALAEELQPG